MRAVILFAVIAIATVKAASDCAVAPSVSTKSAWCTDCYEKTYSELVCSTCNGLHLNVDKNDCIDWDCSVAQTTKSDMWCSGCEITNKFASADSKSCISKDAYCAITPSTSTKTSWCSTCFNNVFTELVCSTCNGLHLNAEKNECLDWDCTKAPTTYDDNWCNACDLTKKVAAADGKSCTTKDTNCAVAPSASTKTAWCSTCYNKVFSELVCSTCNGLHLNAEKNKCLDWDCTKVQTTYDNNWCSACELTKKTAAADGKSCVEQASNECAKAPTTYTTSWCTKCETVKQTASADGKSCVNIDCSVKPAKNYTDDWCNACSNPPTKALTDKTACAKPTSTTASNGEILSLVFSVILALFATL